MGFDPQGFRKEVTKRVTQLVAAETGIQNWTSYSVPRRRDYNNNLYDWEPEESWLLDKTLGFIGANQRLANVSGFKLVPDLRRDFSYVTLGLNAPSQTSLRARFNFYHAPNGRRPGGALARQFSDMSVGIKPRGKFPDRFEFEAKGLQSLNITEAFAALLEKHGEKMPGVIRDFNPEKAFVRGIMAVQRAGFEGYDLISDQSGTHVIMYSGSFDACRTARPDLTGNFGKRYEVEIEASGLMSTNPHLSRRRLVEVIERSLQTVSIGIKAQFRPVMLPSEDPRNDMNKTEQAIFDHAESIKADLKAGHHLSRFMPQSFENQETQLTRLFAESGLNNLTPRTLHGFAAENLDRVNDNTIALTAA